MDRSGLTGREGYRQASSPSTDDSSTSPTSVRRQKLDQHRALMQQRQKMRQAHQGMVLNRGMHGQRPLSASSIQSGYRPPSGRSLSSGLGSTPSNLSAASLGSTSLGSASLGSTSVGSSGGLVSSRADTSRPSLIGNGNTSSSKGSSGSIHGASTGLKGSWLDDLGTEMPSASVQKQTDTERKLAAQNLLSAVDYSESIEEPEELVLSLRSDVGSGGGPASDDDEPAAGVRGAVAPAIPHIPDSQRDVSIPRLDPIGTGTAPPDMPSIDIRNVAEFVFKPAPQNITVKCRVTRKESTYLMHLEQPNGQLVFLLAARNRKKRALNYIISMDSTDLSRSGHSFIGKLRGNFLGTEFTVYDNGANPRKGEALPDGSNVREELAAVIYEKNFMGFHGPRKMTVLVPGMSQSDERVVIKPTSEHETMTERFKHNDCQNLIELHNKEPQWNRETESFVLNFYGRVLQASVKNFQVVHLDDVDYVIMQFGRIGNDQFTLDYCYPFCAVQAFGIALSSCASKLACE